MRFFIESIFRIEDIPGSEIIMIALSSSAVAVIAALVFAALCRARFGFDMNVPRTLICSFAASVVGAAAAYVTLQIFGPLLPTETFLGILAQGVAAGVAGLVFWAVTLFALGSREFSEVLAVLKRLNSKARTDI